MPSSYTAAIVDGRPQTFREFALHVASGLFRALDGAPLPEAFELSPHVTERVESLRVQLEDARRRMPGEWVRLADARYEEHERQRQEALAAIEAIRQRVLARIADVEAWKPPTNDHTTLKVYMLEQLQLTLKHDCNTDGLHEPTRRLNGREMRDRTIQQLEHDLGYFTQALEEERERVQTNNKWLADLRSSLPRR